ncbi:MAG TPA: hypothetical protein VK553_10490 [Candidatus Nitrosopolaris rasttigaisensis]|nr:hypothetical protein [Candidatus Nitrosopolaris rasttigaisensis]
MKDKKWNEPYPENYIDILRYDLATRPKDLKELEKAEEFLGIKEKVNEN